MEEVIGSLDRGLPQRKKIIVMDAGFSSESNLQWLVNHHYDYITVMRSHGQQYTPASDIIEKVSDNKDQEIRLQKVMVEGCAGIVLLVDSDAKTIKERSMEEKAAAPLRRGPEGYRQGHRRQRCQGT
mgnify:FL=1